MTSDSIFLRLRWVGEKKAPPKRGPTFQSYRGAGTTGGGTTTAGPPTVPPLSQTLVVFMAPSASVRDVKTLPSPTITLVCVVGRCSTMVQRFVPVSCTM